MTRTLTPAEWAELERAQREGGIPSVVPDSSVQIQGRPNAYGDLPTQQEQVDFRRRTTGYPRGGLGGILDRVGAGVQEEFGQAKDWVGGILGGDTDEALPPQLSGGPDMPEWLEREYEYSRETGLSMEAAEFLVQFSDALENDDIESAQSLFNHQYPLLLPRDKDELNVLLGISEPVEYDGR